MRKSLLDYGRSLLNSFRAQNSPEPEIDLDELDRAFGLQNLSLTFKNAITTGSLKSPEAETTITQTMNEFMERTTKTHAAEITHEDGKQKISIENLTRKQLKVIDHDLAMAFHSLGPLYDKLWKMQIARPGSSLSKSGEKEITWAIEVSPYS
jgi:hypothetical protein